MLENPVGVVAISTTLNKESALHHRTDGARLLRLAEWAASFFYSDEAWRLLDFRVSD